MFRCFFILIISALLTTWVSIPTLYGIDLQKNIFQISDSKNEKEIKSIIRKESELFQNEKAKQLKIYSPQSEKNITSLKMPFYTEIHWQNVESAKLPYRIYLWKVTERKSFPLALTSLNYYSIIIQEEGEYFVQISDSNGGYRSTKIRFRAQRALKSVTNKNPLNQTKFVALGDISKINFSWNLDDKEVVPVELLIYNKEKKLIKTIKTQKNSESVLFEHTGKYFWAVNLMQSSRVTNKSPTNGVLREFEILSHQAFKKSLLNSKPEHFLNSKTSAIIYLND